MKAVLLRTGSVPVHPPVLSGSSKVSLSRQNSFAGVFSGERNTVSSPKISLHLQINCQGGAPASGIRRVLSESNISRSEREVSGESRAFPERILEEDDFSEGDGDDCGGPLILKRHGVDRVEGAGIWPESGIPVETLGFSGDGFGKGRKSGGGDNGDRGNGGFGSGHGDRSKIGDYYREMLKSNPGDSLLLRNYGKFLHEVENDTEGAEEYYGRAILSSPGDGELLSLYGKLMWETQNDVNRAKSYFDQAVYASPNDCTVLGSYAHFMWEVDQEEEEEENEEMNSNKTEVSPAMVAAF